MNKKINIENTSIRTMTIEVQAIKLNNRQMTLSTFRQIEYDGLIRISEDPKIPCSLLGIPWGKINYFWDGCDPMEKFYSQNPYREYKKIHILWQKGNVLKRDIIKDNKDMVYIDSYNYLIDQLFQLEQLYIAT